MSPALCALPLHSVLTAFSPQGSVCSVHFSPLGLVRPLHSVSCTLRFSQLCLGKRAAKEQHQSRKQNTELPQTSKYTRCAVMQGSSGDISDSKRPFCASGPSLPHAICPQEQQRQQPLASPQPPRPSAATLAAAAHARPWPGGRVPEALLHSHGSARCITHASTRSRGLREPDTIARAEVGSGM